MHREHLSPWCVTPSQFCSSVFFDDGDDDGSPTKYLTRCQTLSKSVKTRLLLNPQDKAVNGWRGRDLPEVTQVSNWDHSAGREREPGSLIPPFPPSLSSLVTGFPERPTRLTHTGHLGSPGSGLDALCLLARLPWE